MRICLSRRAKPCGPDSHALSRKTLPLQRRRLYNGAFWCNSHHIMTTSLNANHSTRARVRAAPGASCPRRPLSLRVGLRRSCSVEAPSPRRLQSPQRVGGARDVTVDNEGLGRLRLSTSAVGSKVAAAAVCAADHQLLHLATSAVVHNLMLCPRAPPVHASFA